MNAKKAKAARRLARKLAAGTPDRAYEVRLSATRKYVNPITDKAIDVPMQITTLGTSFRKAYKDLKRAVSL